MNKIDKIILKIVIWIYWFECVTNNFIDEAMEKIKKKLNL